MYLLCQWYLSRCCLQSGRALVAWVHVFAFGISVRQCVHKSRLQISGILLMLAVEKQSLDDVYELLFFFPMCDARLIVFTVPELCLSVLEQRFFSARALFMIVPNKGSLTYIAKVLRSSVVPAPAVVGVLSWLLNCVFYQKLPPTEGSAEMVGRRQRTRRLP